MEREKEDAEKPFEVPENFTKVMKDLVTDILTTFPEYKEELNELLVNIISEEPNKLETENLFNYAKEVYPERFFDILYQNENIFTDNEINTCFLPNIDFSLLMTDEISENTKNIIWKYLQLILFSIVENVEGSESFGNTAKLFEAIDENVLKEKLQETMKNMSDMFEADDETGEGENDLPNPEEIHEHLNGILNGNLGKLATQITEETLKDLDLDLELNEESSVGEIFKKLFSDPGKLMKMISKVGKSLDEKLKSGEIKESELMEEASEFLKKMNDVPGMKNMSSMFKNMGMPMGNGKMNIGAMQNHMQKNIKMSKMKERMRRKLAERKDNKDEQIRLLEKQLEEARTENKKITGSIKSKRKKRRNRKKNKNKK
jgi:hypothetical protein|uniref:Uncharacterized protein n=1 Tax=viral metagenome TaxID=1070528 RepID=A0A6C0BYC7_9ZZZZ